MTHFASPGVPLDAPADFKNSVTGTFSRKFAIKQSLKIPPHLKRVAIHYLVKYKNSKFAPTAVTAIADHARAY